MPTADTAQASEKKDSWRDKKRGDKKDNTPKVPTPKAPTPKTPTPIKVKSVAEAMALPKGTVFIDPTGKKRVR